MMLRYPLNSAFQLIYANIIDYHIVPYHIDYIIYGPYYMMKPWM